MSYEIDEEQRLRDEIIGLRAEINRLNLKLERSYSAHNEDLKRYAPTINMTKEQYIGLLFDGKGRETAHKNFVFVKEVQEVNDKYVSITLLMNAFAHPETIKVVEEI